MFPLFLCLTFSNLSASTLLSLADQPTFILFQKEKTGRNPLIFLFSLCFDSRVSPFLLLFFPVAQSSLSSFYKVAQMRESGKENRC